MFSAQRFALVFLNDLKSNYRKLLLATAGAMAAFTLLYLARTDTPLPDSELYIPVVLLSLLLGGGLFTGAIYNDMHHPLERYHVLMLPVSAFERFLSRYLLSGPLFYLYVLAMLLLFEQLAGWIVLEVHDTRIPRVDFGGEFFHNISWTFLAGHSLVLLGAICFRSYALARTALSLVLLSLGLAAFSVVVMKLLFFGYFESLFSMQLTRPLNIEPFFAHFSRATMYTIASLLYGWILFVAYACLRDHEV